MPSYLPVTIDGSEIPADAPRSQAMSDETATLVAEKADEYRSHVLHCNYDVADRTITVTASNAPEGPVLFNFGDRSGDLTEQVTGPGESATAEHTYAADGTYEISVRVANPTDRWSTQVAINWPAPFPEVPPAPEE